MKIRNKKTGEIKAVNKGVALIHYSDGTTVGYNSLAELNEDWEDYEEPKGYWYIDPMVCGVYYTKIKKDEDLYDFNKQIGNYFDTQEEAEKAVQKLKAWKRLKDKGFRFDGKTLDTAKRFGSIFYWLDENAYSEEYIADLDLLFGGEE